jgi:pimeloyl-ACP methyl ester carboxylesterase
VFLYLHGFASSPGSTKARAFAGWAASHGIRLEVLDLRVPSFERLLVSAIIAKVTSAIDAVSAERPRARVALVGSSLGGLVACRVAAADPRVSAVFAMAPAFAIAERWPARLGPEAWEAWRTTGWLEVDANLSGATRSRSRVHFGFVEELARIDAERGAFPDVRVPTHIVHGTRDEVVDVALSRSFAKDRPHVHLVELDDGHELSLSIPRILAEADSFFRDRDRETGRRGDGEE